MLAVLIVHEKRNTNERDLFCSHCKIDLKLKRKTFLQRTLCTQI